MENFSFEFQRGYIFEYGPNTKSVLTTRPTVGKITGQQPSVQKAQNNAPTRISN